LRTDSVQVGKDEAGPENPAFCWGSGEADPEAHATVRYLTDLYRKTYMDARLALGKPDR
jgi:hypothetical protein